jgi:ankyrin repeat protein
MENNSILSKFQHLANKIFFKVTNAKENHNGFQYVDGLNILDKEFEEVGSCVVGGLYFTDAHHIFEFLDYGINLREIILPLNDPNFKCVKDQSNKWRANMIILGKKYDLTDVDTFKYLVGLGADFRAIDDYATRKTSEDGYLEIIKYLVSIGADISARNNYAIKTASKNGRLEVVKYLVGLNADFKAGNNYAVRMASEKGHLDVVKFLVECGADFCADDAYAIRWAFINGHSEVVKYLIEKGAKF